MKHVWIVEGRFEPLYRWEPTVGIGLSREDGRNKLKEWSQHNPFGQFRLRKYVQEAK